MAFDERMVNAVERRVRSWRVPPLVADALLTLIMLAPSLGAVLALILRSTAPALSIGLVYILAVEQVILLAWSDGEKWLPGRLISAIAQGGTSVVHYGNALREMKRVASVMSRPE
jgi:hypothetical protein